MSASGRSNIPIMSIMVRARESWLRPRALSRGGTLVRLTWTKDNHIISSIHKFSLQICSSIDGGQSDEKMHSHSEKKNAQ